MASSRRFGWGSVVVAAAVAQRALFVALTHGDPVFRVPYLDGAFYHVWARSLAAGHGDFVGPYFLAPLYPHAMSWLYRIFGADPFVVRIAQSLLGVIDVALVLHLATGVFGKVAGLAAAVAFALYGPQLFYEGILVPDVPLTTLALLALWLVLAERGRPALRVGLAGASLGAAALLRPTALLVVPVAAWIASKPARGPARFQHAGLCAVSCLVVILPVLVRNARLGGGFVITTNGGVNFFAGNGPDANGRFHEPEGVTFFRSPVLDAAAHDANLPPAVAARALTVGAAAGTDEAAQSAVWMQRARTWMRAHPSDALALPLRKAWLLLQGREISQIESYSFQAHRMPMLRACAVDFGWLWPLAALGVWRARRKVAAQTAAIGVWIAALLVPSLVFFVTARHRLIAAPEVALLAGAGVAAVVERLRQREIRRLAWQVAAVAPLALAARLGGQPARGASGWEQAQMAERFYAAGALGDAIAAQERAAAELTGRFEVQVNLALYWSERGAAGDLERAEQLLEQAARKWPAEPTVIYNLGVIEAERGRTTEAAQAWRATLRLDPAFEPARARLAELKNPAPTSR